MNARSSRRPRGMGRLAALGVAVVVAVPLTTGCQTRLGEAATVGDTRISTSQLNSMTDRSSQALAATGQSLPPGQQGTLQRGVLNLLVRNALLQQIAADKGITLTQGQLAAERASEVAQAGGESAFITQSEQGGISPQDIDLLVRYQLLLNRLQAKFGSSDTTAFAKSLTTSAQQIPVRINPRFGSWDSKTLTVVGAPNDLSSPVVKS